MDKLRENYCFFCGAHGKDNKNFCMNCLCKTGDYPSEVSALLLQARLDELENLPLTDGYLEKELPNRIKELTEQLEELK